LVLRVTGQGYSLRPVYAGYQFVPADDLFDAPSLVIGLGGWLLVAAIRRRRATEVSS